MRKEQKQNILLTLDTVRQKLAEWSIISGWRYMMFDLYSATVQVFSSMTGFCVTSAF